MKRKARRLQYAGVIVLLLFAVLYTKEEITLAGNESSRFGVIQALGEQGVFHIERTNFASTVDRVEWNGHVYSDKPLPLSSAAAVKRPHAARGPHSSCAGIRTRLASSGAQ